MSKRKPAKRPLSKATIALNTQLQRKHGVRELANRFLIVCEDDKSAPNYFEALKKHFNLSAASIRVAGSGGNTQPVQVVQRAIEINVAASNADSGTEPFQHVWCVLDGDCGDKINNARSKADANGIKLAISTMCFEYWILLHFEENSFSTLDCDEMVRTLRDKKKKYIPNYHKGKCDFQGIVTQVDQACLRAEKIRRPGILRGDPPERQNPCSEVYLLIRAILEDQK